MTRKKQKNLTWNRAIDAYELHLRARRAALGTIDEQLLDLGHLAAHFRPLRVDQVHLQDLREYQVGLYAGETSHSRRPLAPRTVAKVTSTVRRFFGFLTEDGLLVENPTARLEQPRVPRKGVGNVLTVKQVQKLIGAADLASAIGLRDRAIAETLYATGVRRAELIALDLSDLCHDERELTVQQGKGGKGRRVPLTRSAYASVAAYLERARPGFMTAHPDSASALFLTGRGMRINHMTLTHTFRKLVKAAKLRARVTAHTLRRSCATHLLKGGASLRHIQLLLGHADLGTTAFYLKLDTRELRREVLLHHPRERFEA